MLIKEPCKELGIAIPEPEHLTYGPNVALLGRICGGDRVGSDAHYLQTTIAIRFSLVR